MTTVFARINSTPTFARHPLWRGVRPGPTSEKAEDEQCEAILAQASDVIDMVERGELPTRAPPMPIIKSKRLTVQEEQMLAYRIQTWGCVESRNVLVEKNVGLVGFTTSKYAGYRAYPEIFDAGRTGLIRAAETYDPSRGLRFSTYAVYWIRARAQRAFAVYQRNENPKTVDVGRTTKNGYRQRVSAPMRSLHEPVMVDADGFELGDTIPDPTGTPEDALLKREAARDVRAALRDAVEAIGDPRLTKLIELRLVADEPLSLTEVGHALDLSREGVRILQNKLLRHMRAHMKED